MIHITREMSLKEAQEREKHAPENVERDAMVADMVEMFSAELAALGQTMTELTELVTTLGGVQ